MTLAIAMLIPLSLLIYSNSRITETKETLRAEIGKLAAELRGEMNELRTEVRGDIHALRAEMNAGFARIEAAMKIHELEHHK